jgi:glutamate decarboxylase
MPQFRLLSAGDELPVFAFTTVGTRYDVFAVSRGLRERGWQVPAYTYPPDREDLAVLRVVCRNGFSRDLADEFIAHLREVVAELDATGAGGTGLPARSGFRH